jgi:hypothetical protein
MCILCTSCSTRTALKRIKGINNSCFQNVVFPVEKFWNNPFHAERTVHYLIKSMESKIASNKTEKRSIGCSSRTIACGKLWSICRLYTKMGTSAAEFACSKRTILLGYSAKICNSCIRKIKSRTTDLATTCESQSPPARLADKFSDNYKPVSYAMYL